MTGIASEDYGDVYFKDDKLMCNMKLKMNRLSNQITGGVNQDNTKVYVIQDAVDVVVVEDADKDKEDKEDEVGDNDVVPPPLLGHNEPGSGNESDSNDKEEVTPVPASFSRGRYTGCRREKKQEYRADFRNKSRN